LFIRCADGDVGAPGVDLRIAVPMHPFLPVRSFSIAKRFPAANTQRAYDSSNNPNQANPNLLVHTPA